MIHGDARNSLENRGAIFFAVAAARAGFKLCKKSFIVFVDKKK